MIDVFLEAQSETSIIDNESVIVLLETRCVSWTTRIRNERMCDYCIVHVGYATRQGSPFVPFTAHMHGV